MVAASAANVVQAGTKEFTSKVVLFISMFCLYSLLITGNANSF